MGVHLAFLVLFSAFAGGAGLVCFAVLKLHAASTVLANRAHIPIFFRPQLAGASLSNVGRL